MLDKLIFVRLTQLIIPLPFSFSPPLILTSPLNTLPNHCPVLTYPDQFNPSQSVLWPVHTCLDLKQMLKLFRHSLDLSVAQSCKKSVFWCLGYQTFLAENLDIFL